MLLILGDFKQIKLMKGLLDSSSIETWSQGYKTLFMLNSTEQEISTAHKN